MAHPAAGGSGGTGNEPGDRFPAMFLDPGGGFLFGGAADLADHDHAVGVGIGVEHFDDVEVGGAINGIAADADAGGLADAAAGELPNGLVGQSAATRDDADVALFMDVARGDADAAAPEGIFARTGGDDAGAIGSDEARGLAVHGAFDLHHVVDGDPLGDANDEVQAGVDAFENSVGGEGGRDKDSGGRSAGLFAGLRDGVEDGNFIVEVLAAFSRRDAGDDQGAVGEAELGVAGTEAAGDSLDQNASGWSDEDGHGRGG